jgi:hypothetical protein
MRCSVAQKENGKSLIPDLFRNDSTATLDVINDTSNNLILKIMAKLVDYMVSFISQKGLVVFELLIRTAL